MAPPADATEKAWVERITFNQQLGNSKFQLADGKTLLLPGHDVSSKFARVTI